MVRKRGRGLGKRKSSEEMGGLISTPAGQYGEEIYNNEASTDPHRRVVPGTSPTGNQAKKRPLRGQHEDTDVPGVSPPKMRKLSSACKQCPSKDEQIACLNNDVKRLQTKLETGVSRDVYDAFMLKYEAEKTAKDEALRRLSAMVSSRLRQNNPNIADLSDQNRPTKIAEKLSELYDNEWTDAFDALEEDMSEMEILYFLRDVLMKSYQECKIIASEKYFEKVQRCIELPVQMERDLDVAAVLPDELKQQIKEFRKDRAVHVIKDVEKAVKLKLQSLLNRLDSVQRYVSECVKICWLMVVQDPPLVLTATASTKFDTNTFKDYTKRGPYVEYVVWPALLLYEGGSLMAKGVAQGCNSPPKTH